MACVAAKRESCVLAGCAGAPAPAQELLAGLCDRVVSIHSRDRAAKPVAEGGKWLGQKKGGRG